MTGSEMELARRAIAGDEDALAELLEEFGPQVRQRLGGRIGAQWQSVFEEDDVLQITYLEAFLRIGRFECIGEGAFLAWLTRIAENNLRDAIRELGRVKRPQPANRVESPSGDESYAALCDVLRVTSVTPSHHAARGEARRILDGAIEKLPADYARVVRLYDLEGRSAAEVAGAMGRSTGAVYMLRARAHDCIRELLGPESAFFSDTG